MKIYFVRHGESEANLLREFSNRGFKHGLTEKGEAQADALAQKLDRCAVARIMSSPLMRAVQTAEILASVLKVPYEIHDALREFDCGVLEGRSDEASWLAHQAVVEAWTVHHRWDSRIEGGESFNEIKARFVPLIEQLVAKYDRTTESVVLVGHGGLYRCMLPLILKNIDVNFAQRHALSNTAYVVAEVKDGQLICVEWDGMRGPFSAF